MRFREDIPTARECQMLWRRYGTTKEVIAHCRLVAEVARTLAVHLNCAGLHLDPELIVAAGYLHDLAKGQPDHAAAGAQILEEMGYGRVGRIVAGHMDLPLQKHPIDESDLIYLADKYVAGDRLVSLQERFEGPLRKFADKPDILEKVVRRLKNTQTLKGRVEKALGIPLAEIMQRREKRVCGWLQSLSPGRFIWSGMGPFSLRGILSGISARWICPCLPKGFGRLRPCNRDYDKCRSPPSFAVTCKGP